MTRYRQLEALGLLKIYTARLDDSLLVGYAVFLVQRNAHYASSLQAVQDVLYVHPAYRQSRIGIDLIRFSEQQLREEGVQCLFHHVKRAHPVLGRILERRRYEPVETIYAKRLDR